MFDPDAPPPSGDFSTTSTGALPPSSFQNAIQHISQTRPRYLDYQFGSPPPSGGTGSIPPGTQPPPATGQLPPPVIPTTPTWGGLPTTGTPGTGTPGTGAPAPTPSPIYNPDTITAAQWMEMFNRIPTNDRTTRDRYNSFYNTYGSEPPGGWEGGYSQDPYNAAYGPDGKQLPHPTGYADGGMVTQQTGLPGFMDAINHINQTRPRYLGYNFGDPNYGGTPTFPGSGTGTPGTGTPGTGTPGTGTPGTGTPGTGTPGTGSGTGAFNWYAWNTPEARSAEAARLKALGWDGRSNPSEFVPSTTTTPATTTTPTHSTPIPPPATMPPTTADNAAGGLGSHRPPMFGGSWSNRRPPRPPAILLGPVLDRASPEDAARLRERYGLAPGGYWPLPPSADDTNG